MMNLFCKNDPILDLLENVLEANISRLPDARLQALGVIELLSNNKFKFRSTLGKLLTQSSDLDINDKYIETKQLANISGEKTQSTDCSFGLEILRGFLTGFGCSIPNLKGHFTGARKVSFSFENVQRRWLDNGLLGEVLRNVKIDASNVANAGYFKTWEASKLLVIDSAVVSNDFSIHVEDSDSDSFGFDAEAIEKEMLKASTSVKVSSTNKTSLTFKGDNPLPFAFSCLHVQIDATGKVIALPPFSQKIKTLMSGGNEIVFEKTRLAAQLQLLDIE